MKRWEYLTEVNLDLDPEKDLHEYGSEGWELVSIFVVPRHSLTDVNVVWVFKREVA